MEEVKVTEQPKVEEKKTEAPTKTTTRRGRKPRTEAVKKETKVEKKTPVKRGAKKTTDKKTKTTAPKVTKTAPAQNFVFGKPVFQFKDKEINEELINKKVLDYLNKHPYIHAEKVETFVNLEEGKVYFTVDGFGNADFSVEL